VSSALAQSNAGDEVIVIDDGSTDNTEEMLTPYRDRLRYIKIPNSGAGIARNRGIKEARNNLVAFLDSDDEWMPGKLELQRSLMQSRPDILFCFSDFARRSVDGREHHHHLINWHNDSRSWDEILGPGVLYSSISPLPSGIDDFKIHVGDLYSLELTANYIFAGTLLVRRREAGGALHFGEGLPTYEDWECFGRLARKGPAAYLDCETAWQVSHGGDRLTDTDMATSAATRITLIERVWGADPEFLEKHGDIYRKTIIEQRLHKIRALISQGKTGEARSEMRLVDSAPLLYRLLSVLPGLFVRGLILLRRKLRGDS
jgi:glycosyltransferase involved in cell wall biosynthesis